MALNTLSLLLTPHQVFIDSANTNSDYKVAQGATERGAEACSLQAAQDDRLSNDGIRSNQNWYNRDWKISRPIRILKKFLLLSSLITTICLISSLQFAIAASKNSSNSSGGGSDRNSDNPTPYGYQQLRPIEDEIKLNDRNNCQSMQQEVNSLFRDYKSTCAATNQTNCDALISSCYPDGESSGGLMDQIKPMLTQAVSHFMSGAGTMYGTCPQLTGSDYASAKTEIMDRIKDAKREIEDAQKDLADKQTENERSKNDAQADQDKSEKDAADDIAKLKEDQQEALKNAADESRKVQKEIMNLTTTIKGKASVLAQKINARIASTQLLTDDFIRNGCLQELVDARKKYTELMGNLSNGIGSNVGSAKSVYDQQKKFLETSWQFCMQKGLQSRLTQNQQAMAEEAQMRQEIQDAQQSITMLNDQINQDKMNLNYTIQNFTNKELVIKTDLYKQAMNLQNKVNTLAQDTYRQTQLFMNKQAQSNSDMIQFQRDLQELGAPPPRGATETLAKAHGKYSEYIAAQTEYETTCRSYIKQKGRSPAGHGHSSRTKK